MDVSIKQKIIDSKIYPFLVFILNTWGLFKRIRGNSNSCMIDSTSLFRKTFINVNGRNNMIKIGSKCRFRNFKINVNGDNNTITIGDKLELYDYCNISIIGDNCNVNIGNSTTIGSTCLYLEESNTSVSIGDECMFGRAISISTTDFHSVLDKTTMKRINYPKDVFIGNHVWIGYDVEINKGSSIMDDSVVGSHSLVTKKFDKKSLCIAGVPAKIIKENITWSRKKI